MEEDSMKAWTGSILVLREEVTDSGGDSTWNGVHCLVVCIDTCTTYCDTLTVHTARKYSACKVGSHVPENCTDSKYVNGLRWHSF